MSALYYVLVFTVFPAAVARLGRLPLTKANELPNDHQEVRLAYWGFPNDAASPMTREGLGSMRDLVDTTEMYLRTIYELEEEGITPLRARIAERLGQSGPTVSQTVARMERDGLVNVAPNRSLEMTAKGRETAIAVMRKHRLAERLLTDVIGMDIQKVHDEACRWEHVMSDEVERRLVDVLGNYTTSPFGNPIPGLDRIGVEKDVPKKTGDRAIDAASATPRKVRIVQINEIFQFETEAMSALLDAGVAVGEVVTLQLKEGHVVLSRDGRSIELIDDLAHAIRIEEL